MRSIRSRLTFANVTSVIALFVALGGSAYAGFALPKDSVGAREIKKNGVRASEIKKNAVTASEVKRNAVGSSEIRPNAVAADAVANNAIGNADLADNAVGSDEIIDGSIGENDLAAGLLEHTVTVQRTDVAMADNSTGSAEAVCPAGQQAISGGASVEQTTSDDISLLVSRPGNGGLVPVDGQEFANTWRVVYRNPAGGTAAATIRAFVLCADIP